MQLSPEAEERIRELKSNPIAALGSYKPLPQWDMGRHKDLIERRRRKFAIPSEAADDDTFLQDLYLILKAWHGSRAWLLIPFDDGFKHEIRKAALKIDHLSDLSITDANYDIDTVTCQLWDAIAGAAITTGDAKIVSGTKAIHHLIPDMIPPMDNRYTGEFFLGYGIGQGGKAVFRRIYRAFSSLAHFLTSHEEFMECVGTDLNTSVMKTVDNAIIGYIENKRRTA